MPCSSVCSAHRSGHSTLGTSVFSPGAPEPEAGPGFKLPAALPAPHSAWQLPNALRKLHLQAPGVSGKNAKTEGLAG